MPIAPGKIKPRSAARELWWPILVLATALAATQAVSIFELIASR